MKLTTRVSCFIYVVLYFAAIACAIHFDPGDVYNYSYSTDISMNEADEPTPAAGSHRAVGFRMSGDVKLTVVWKHAYDYLMKLEFVKSNLHSVSRESLSTDFKELRSYPVYFHWHADGTVGRVFLAMDELTVSANLKKGIISLLQMQTVDGQRTEVDASGECSVEYKVKGNVVTKSKSNCKNLEVSGQYQQSNPLLDSSLISISKTEYEFADNAIQSAQAVDTQLIFVTADKSIDMESISRQSLTLLSKSKGGVVLSASGIDEAVEAADPGSTLDLIGMLLGTDVESAACLVDCESLADAVDEHKADLVTDKVALVESPKAFNKILPIFRQASKDKITAVLKQHTDILPQLLDIAAAAQTDAAIDAVMEVVNFDSASDYEMAERFVMSCSFATHPKENLLKALLKLHRGSVASPELSDSIALSLGAVTHTYCRVAEQCSSQVVKDIEETLLGDLEKAETALRSVRALRNARLQGSKVKLIELAETSTDPPTISASIQALEAVNSVYSSKNVIDAMGRIYHQRERSYDSGVRTSALSILLKNGPTVPEIRNVVLSTINQTDKHISTYVLQTLHDLSASNPMFKQKFVQAIGDIRMNNYHTQSPGGKANALTSYLGRSTFTDIVYKLFMQNAQTGIMKKSGMQVSLKVSDVVSQPILMFSLYAQGLESMIDSSAIPEGQEPEDPTAGLSLDIFDVLLRPVQFFKGSSQLMSAVWNAPSSPVTALAINVLTHDKNQKVHLQNGLVLEHKLSGVASIKLSGFISISLWNQDAHSVIKNSGASVLSGGLFISTNNHLSAGVSFKKSAAAFIDFITDVNFYVTPPQVCLRMALDPFVISENWKKTEQARGISKRATFSLQRTQSIPGASYLLSDENSRQCTKLLEK